MSRRGACLLYGVVIALLLGSGVAEANGLIIGLAAIAFVAIGVLFVIALSVEAVVYRFALYLDWG